MVELKDLQGYKVNDKFLIKDNKLYKLSSKKLVGDYQDTDDTILVVKISDNHLLYYTLVPESEQNIAIQLEQYKLTEIIAQAQLEKMIAINAKLNFFVVLTIISIIVTILHF